MTGADVKAPEIFGDEELSPSSLWADACFTLYLETHVGCCRRALGPNYSKTERLLLPGGTGSLDARKLVRAFVGDGRFRV